MANRTILIVEEEPDIFQLVHEQLTQQGYDVHRSQTMKDAALHYEELEPDLVILGIGAHTQDGLNTLTEIRSYSNVPIVLLSSRGEPADIIHGLELGADDYIVKPFDPKVLSARVQANLRRSAIFRRNRRWKTSLTVSAPPKEEVMIFDSLEIDPIRFQVMLDGQALPLVTKEIQLLSFLARSPGTVYTLEELYEAVWGMESNGNTRTVIVHLSNLRKKLEPHPSRTTYIHNIRGVGYKFEPKRSTF
ncbi:response regulator transcription factor [Paenibacillus sp. YYML68]|uniref:response regulator transcription factor n=1 Tax=Paenibacillus sp. YYML68 TaxID=2909250 RepID=UPI0024904CA2|nr:response regulator transcription factor [Paenibacillus sp. YYML68]